MRTILIPITSALLVTAVVWGLILGWWQANGHQPSDDELKVYLGVVPLFLVGGFWLLRGFIDHLKAPPPSSVAGNDPQTSDPAPAPGAPAADAERHATLTMIGAAALSGAGDTPAAILAALADGQRPALDAELRDGNGFPVFAARVPDLDLDAAREALDDPGAPLTERMLRSLALLQSALPPLIDLTAEALRTAPPDARLHVNWLIPCEWVQPNIRILRSWLEGGLVHALDPTRRRVDMITLTPTQDALDALDQLVRATAREPANHDLHLLIAADSLLDDDTVAALDIASALHGTTRPDGTIPGECAVALLFANAHDARAHPFEHAMSVSRVSRATRSHPLGASGRPSGALLGRLIADLLALHAVETSAVPAVLTDTDHRPRHTAELMDALGERFTDLDPLDDCPAIGTACGSVGTLGALVTLACAFEKLREVDAPVLCLSNQHATLRAALLVRPLSHSEAASTPS